MDFKKQAQGSIFSFFTAFLSKSELVLPAAVVLIIVMMVIPVPVFMINFLVAISLTISILTILITMYVKEPLEFAVFPTVILISTIFRLALSITTTRAILLHADAGEIISAFGTFVTGGSYVVGAIIFAIIVIVNYVVITHGAQRIGEVAARFTLDAMPGKQMSIDADLNNGLITDEQARERRKKIELEADYFGAMDGASRFVQRDAIAGIIITIVNILGGFIIGVAIKKMPWMEAVQTYTMLTIGEGLAAAIPTILISSATGIMVTNAASEANLSKDVVGQMLGQPRVMYAAGLILSLFAAASLLTMKIGLIVPLFVMAGLVLGLGYAFDKLGLSFAGVEAKGAAAKGMPGRPGAAQSMSAGSGAPSPSGGQAGGSVPAYATPEAVQSLLYVDSMELEIGYGLIPLVDPDQKGDLLDRVTMIRRQTALEMGIIVPPIRIRDNIQLRPNEYSVKIKGTEVAGGTLMVDYFLAMNPGNVSQEIDGVDTTEPAFGLPAKWIREANKEQAEMIGYTVVDPASVVATHLTEVIKNHSFELLGRQEVQSLIEIVKERNSVVVDELIPNKLELGEVQKVLQNLLRERVSIRNLATILELLADYAAMTKDVNVLTEYVRAGLARQICRQHQMPDGTIPVITIDPRFEDAVLESVHDAGTASYPVLAPEVIEKLSKNLSAMIEKAISLNYQPIVMCSPRVRMYIRRLVERLFPSLVVLSHSEIVPDAKVRSVGMIGAG
ncbi:MAG: flagellar biosynthesis protein FlhA [bacterium]